MTTPTCDNCGAALGIGRFCTNCGKPVAGRHPEAAPPVAVPPPPVVPPAQQHRPASPTVNAPATPPPAQPPGVVPPPAAIVPPAARYPLYAEGAGAPQTEVVPPPAVPVDDLFKASYDGHTNQTGQTGGRRWWPWIAAIVVLVLVAGIGALLLLGGGDDTDKAAGDQSSQAGPSGQPTSPSSDGSSPDQPDAVGSEAPAPNPDDIADLSSLATADVPDVAAPSRDRQNKPVTFKPENLFDHDPRTAWRMGGDGSGATITIDLGSEVVLTEVGIINGYAKVDGPTNWYQGNRKVRLVQWEFDNGTRITQELALRPTLQSLPVGPIATTRIRLHLLEVGAPGTGPDSRDYTAISEVRLTGAS